MSHSETRVSWKLSTTLPSVKDAGPGMNAVSEVVLLSLREGLRTGYYDAGGEFGKAGWRLTDDDGSPVEPTHWAELPPPPVLVAVKPLPEAVGLWWVMSKLFGRKFPMTGEAHHFMKKVMVEEVRMVTAPIVGADGVEVKQPLVSSAWLLSHFAGMRYSNAGEAAESVFRAYQAGTDPRTASRD